MVLNGLGCFFAAPSCDVSADEIVNKFLMRKNVT